MADEPETLDPIPDLVQASIAMHVLFETHRAAGFTEDQALKLIALMSAAIAQNAQKPQEPEL